MHPLTNDVFSLIYPHLNPDPNKQRLYKIAEEMSERYGFDKKIMYNLVGEILDLNEIGRSERRDFESVFGHYFGKNILTESLKGLMMGYVASFFIDLFSLNYTLSIISSICLPLFFLVVSGYNAWEHNQKMMQHPGYRFTQEFKKDVRSLIDYYLNSIV